ncbi:MAG: response regulator [Parachlamydiaceae bacterium]|nr:response regulator [Parachlamydiaceae bacterium]
MEIVKTILRKIQSNIFFWPLLLTILAPIFFVFIGVYFILNTEFGNQIFSHLAYASHKQYAFVFSEIQNKMIALGFISILGASLLTYFISKQMQKLKNKSDNLSTKLEIANKSIEQAFHTKSTFLSNITHELRTPLNAVIGYSELLSEELQEKGLTEYLPDLTRINSAGKHLLALLNNALDLSKIEAGKIELSLTNVNINQFLSEIESVALSLAEKGHNNFILQYSPSLGSIYTDVAKLRQSLLNIILNACKFTESGTVTLNADYFEKDEKLWVKFEVMDNGSGISEKKLNYLVKNLKQTNPQYTLKGTGLGLFISTQFCRMLGGDISISSKEGVGSTFIITIPAICESCTKHDSSDKLREIKISEKSGFVESRGTVLIIDANPSFHEFIETNLGKNFRLIHTYNGKDGLEMATFYHPDVVTLDVNLPEMDGRKIINLMKLDETLHQIPIIITTALPEKDFDKSAGVSDFLAKPIQPKKLLEALKKYTTDDSPLVLVVDDEPEARNYLTRLLYNAGCKVVEAKNGLEALECLQESEPSLILLDLLMPKMDGFEFVARLQGSENWSKIPIIVVSVKDLTNEELQILNAGGVEQIYKKGAFGQKEFSSVIKYQIESAIDRSQLNKNFKKSLVGLEEQFSSEEKDKLEKKLILIIDAAKGVYNTLELQLKEANLEIIQAYDGESGLLLAQKNYPDLILLDVLLPGIDGWQVLAQLKAHVHLKSIPVIMLTQMTTENFGYSRGVADYLVKPVSGQTLVDHIKKNIALREVEYVLVVDDDEAMRYLYVTTLQKAGWKVQQAVSGREALEKIQQKIPVLILLDIIMPEMDGFAVIGHLKHNPEWNDIPVIVLTAANLSDEELERLNKTSLKVFQKSNYRRSDLLKAVREIIQ